MSRRNSANVFLNGGDASWSDLVRLYVRTEITPKEAGRKDAAEALRGAKKEVRPPKQKLKVTENA